MSSIRKRAPAASSAVVRRVMRSVRRRDTAPEVELRRMLYSKGLRYRIDARPEKLLRCKADLVFRRHRLCIFVDGCFWHGCPEHGRVPQTNADWWQEKIADNRSRDSRQQNALESLGWTVLRFWEHDLRSNLFSCIAQVVSATNSQSKPCSS